MNNGIKDSKIKVRYNITMILVYIIAIILILRLFSLQIVHGAEYRLQSNTRLTRESTLEAARGSILDRSGNKIATTKMSFKLEFYKSKIDTQTLNDTILKLVNLLEENNVSISDSFPININPFSFNFSSKEKEEDWKKSMKIDTDLNAEESFYEIKEKYSITNESVEDARKIMKIRYKITQEGYSSTKPLTIAKNIPSEVVAVLSEKNDEFPGVNVVVEPVRSYPSGSLASHIVGYVGVIKDTEYEEKKDTYDIDDIIGRTGIESLFEDYLKGKDGTKQIDMSVDGTITGEYVTEEAVAGADVVLTIDANLQAVTQKALAENINKIANGGFETTHDVNAGVAVVMNVKTGEVLAMASYPDFDPNLFVGGISTENWSKYNSEEAHTPLINRAIQSQYAPGSTFKMITAIAGLETGTIGINDKINDTGVYPKYTHPVCWYYTEHHRGHGYVNVSTAIKQSCNYFFYEISDRMGIDAIEKYARYFGLGEKTGIELPSETSGVLASKSAKAKLTNGEEWYPGETLSAAIGQSYNSFSPLQMAKYISILCNGGKQIEPTIVKTIVNADGTEVQKEEIEKYVNEKLGYEPEEKEDLNIKEENLNAVLEGTKSVTSETGGTAYHVFKDFDIEVGGKTGSAQAGDKVNAWFVGFAPYDDPEIAVVVMVENGTHGSYTAEVVKEIIGEYFGMNSKNIEESVEATAYTESMR